MEDFENRVLRRIFEPKREHFIQLEQRELVESSNRYVEMQWPL
jgi:hypothetical protein